MEINVTLELLNFLNSKDLTIEDYIFLFHVGNNDIAMMKFYTDNDRLHIQNVQKLFGRGYIDTSSEELSYAYWFLEEKGSELLKQINLIK